jgi:exosortase E/protease (VPEID-CTERM system)
LQSGGDAGQVAAVTAGTGGGRPDAPFARWAVVLGVLVAEYIALSLRYDVLPLRSQVPWLADLGTLAPLGVVVLAAFLLFRGPLDEPARATLARALEPTRRWWVWAALHVVAAVSLAALCERALVVNHPAPSVSGRWLLGWALAVLATVGTALATALPVHALGPLRRILGRPLLAGLAIGLAAWGIGSLTQPVGDRLTGSALRATTAVLSVIAGPDLVVEPRDRTLVLDDFAVEVSSLCSGAEGMGLMLVLVGVYLVRFRSDLRFPQALVLVALAPVLAYVANIVRMSALLWVGGTMSAAVAYGGFHSKAGWVLYCGLALGLVAWVRRSPWFSREVPAVEGDNPAAIYLGPLLVGLALALLTGLVSDGFEALYPVRVLGVALALWFVRKSLPSPRWAFSPVPLAVGVLVLVLWLLLAHSPSLEEGEMLRARLAGMGLTGRAWVVFRVLGAVVTVPIAEELAFRGFLMRRLVRADFWEVDLARAGRRLWPLVGSSLAFGVLHSSMLAGALAGVAYGLVAGWRGRLADAVVAHGLTNGLLMAWGLLRGEAGWLL